MGQTNTLVHSPEPGLQANPDGWWTLAAVECGNFAVSMHGVTVTLTLLPAGRQADFWGSRHIVVLGMGFLVLSSVLCALAPTVQTLIAFRILQGLSGGLFQPPDNSATPIAVPGGHLSVANGILAMAR